MKKLFVIILTFSFFLSIGSLVSAQHIYLPQKFTEESSSTTDLKEIEQSQLSEVTGLVFEDIDYGKVEFLVPVNLSDDDTKAKLNQLDRYLQFGQGFVDFKSNNLPVLNTSAKVSLYNIEAESNKKLIILKDGDEIDTKTSNVNYNPSTQTVTFDVDTFSRYEIKIVDPYSVFVENDTNTSVNNGGLIIIGLFVFTLSIITILYLLESVTGVFSKLKRK